MAVSARGVQRSRISSVRPSCAGQDREALGRAQLRAAPSVDSARAPIGIRDVGRHRARLRATDLVAADGTAIDLAERGVGLAVPDELVDDDRPAAGRAVRGEELVERLAQPDLAARLSAEGVDGGVEVAQVGRPQDDLGHQARERRRLVDVGAAQAGDGGPGDPAAPAVQVDDDVAGVGARLDLGHDQVERRRRREAVERGQARSVVRPDERREGSRHRRSVYRRARRPTDGRRRAYGSSSSSGSSTNASSSVTSTGRTRSMSSISSSSSSSSRSSSRSISSRTRVPLV